MPEQVCPVCNDDGCLQTSEQRDGRPVLVIVPCPMRCEAEQRWQAHVGEVLQEIRTRRVKGDDRG